MEILKDFILSFIELITITYLWDKLALKRETSIWKNIIIISIGSLAMSIGVYVKISFIVMYISLILIYSYIYKRNIFTTSLEFFMISIGVGIVKILQIKILKIIGIQNIHNFKIYIIINFITLFCIVVFYKLVLSKRNIYIKNLRGKAIYCFTITYGLYVMILKFIWKYDKNMILGCKVRFLIIIILLLIVHIYLYIYVARIVQVKKELEIKNRYIPVIDNMIEEIRRRQHDFKNNINTVNGIIEIADDSELREKLKGYMLSLNSSNTNLGDIMYINNTIIKAIIYSKVCEAQKNNIEFIYNVKNNSLEDILKEYEISDILNNILNNAFEALENKENNKVVVLNILIKNGKNVIEVKNNGDKINSTDIKNMFKRGFSTKPGQNRGYGLYNVKKIVDCNGGTIQLSFEDDFLNFYIVF
ncbi:sensor histidine kinase [Clostridium botulinum]|uniref:sensor histidine kinase n=1 Tax=Clostridium botulinum TaxID=1491 RepID=UPI0003762820|nr:GHKL domain-containing protein [Clostridium botulinum]MCD3254860.1 GHKL domain-containing protein [Clostridium botulinum C/D]KEH96726.1 histidine kinase [Clostridium botulinum D str. 16868]KLU74562.1 histidine kinase [Clostridium botulinum V891]MCD3280346.1 GHKL domain-containing protein [Clostridium botulinum C/D]MCD3282643.1 GHKL domain-containing protein [Clostridium botulinum C/D]